MSSPTHREQLLMRHLDGELSAEESRELETWLRGDPSARAWLQEIAVQAVSLGDLARERGTLGASSRQIESKASSGQRFRTAWLALAASIVLVGCAVVVWFGIKREVPREIVEIEDVTGALNWTGPTGELRSGLFRGQKLSAGMLETAGEDAVAQLRFADGTRITLGNNTQVAISVEGEKKLRLKSGSLACEVMSQPSGQPFIVRTPTAILRVLGTVFQVTASAEETTLKVEKGRVRLERLTDGSVVEVADRQTAVATVSQAAQFQTRAYLAPPVLWRRTFEQPPLPHWKGDWRPAAGNDPALVRAVPCVVSQREDGMPVYQLGVTARGDGTRLVTLLPESMVRVRWRTSQPITLRVMLSVQTADGGFGGNFLARIPKEATQPDVGGWRTATVSLREFEALIPRHPAPPERGQVSLLFVSISSNDIDFQIAELAIEPSDSAQF